MLPSRPPEQGGLLWKGLQENYAPSRKSSQNLDGLPWLMPIILATKEAEIRRILVPNTLRQIVPKTQPRKNPAQKRADKWLKW
jgi:hypothetical protein